MASYFFSFVFVTPGCFLCAVTHLTGPFPHNLAIPEHIFFHVSWHILKNHMLMKTNFLTKNCLRHEWIHRLGYISEILKPYFLEADHTLKAAKRKKIKLPITANSFLQLTCTKQTEGTFNSRFSVNASSETRWNEAVAKSRLNVPCLTTCRI